MAKQETGLDAASIGFDIRLYGQILGDGVERIGIGHEMHRDEMARPCFEIVETAKSANWQKQVAGHVIDTARHVARLHDRRRSFDPLGEGRLAPRRAWDIHPVAASILSHYRRLPAFDGSHRIDGAVGRVVRLDEAPGIVSCTVAYGDGVIRLVEADLEGGGRIWLKDDRLHVRVPGCYPETVANALRGRRAERIATQFSRDPRGSSTRITKVERCDDHLQVMLADRLVPWDRRAKGAETWRTRRLAA